MKIEEVRQNPYGTEHSEVLYDDNIFPTPSPIMETSGTPPTHAPTTIGTLQPSHLITRAPSRYPTPPTLQPSHLITLQPFPLYTHAPHPYHTLPPSFFVTPEPTPKLPTASPTLYPTPSPTPPTPSPTDYPTHSPMPSPTQDPYKVQLQICNTRNSELIDMNNELGNQTSGLELQLSSCRVDNQTSANFLAKCRNNTDHLNFRISGLQSQNHVLLSQLNASNSNNAALSWEYHELDTQCSAGGDRFNSAYQQGYDSRQSEIDREISRAIGLSVSGTIALFLLALAVVNRYTDGAVKQGILNCFMGRRQEAAQATPETTFTSAHSARSCGHSI